MHEAFEFDLILTDYRVSTVLFDISRSNIISILIKRKASRWSARFDRRHGDWH